MCHYNPASALAETLNGLIGQEATALAVAARDVKPVPSVPSDDLDIWESKLGQQVANDPVIGDTKASALNIDKLGDGSVV